jgi:hypothetical protein
MSLKFDEVYENLFLKENSEGWQDAPDSLGWWWFYGDPTFGAVLNQSPKKDLHCVPIVHKEGSVFISSYRGAFWHIRPYNPEDKSLAKRLHGREGYLGYWKKCDLPQLPEWTHEYE